MSRANGGLGRGAPLSGPLLPLLQHFDAAARHRSFTRAAEELNVTQGAVSQQMRLLEGRLAPPCSFACRAAWPSRPRGHRQVERGLAGGAVARRQPG